MQRSDNYDGTYIDEHHCFQLRNVLTIPEVYYKKFLMKVKTDIFLTL